MRLFNLIYFSWGDGLWVFDVLGIIVCLKLSCLVFFNCVLGWVIRCMVFDKLIFLKVIVFCGRGWFRVEEINDVVIVKFVVGLLMWSLFVMFK